MDKAKDKISPTDSVYTTGAFLVPLRVKIDGSEKWQWRWVVSDFGVDGGEYLDGEETLFYEYADDINGLIKMEYSEE